jgi:flagellar hook-associated protein 1 FlgK
MPISSFFGLQTSLRGLLAQQRMLDTTGHNIANTATKGYSRQEATLTAAPALEIAAGGISSGAGAHLGAGVEVQSFRRVRDQFMDLQFRAQNSKLSEWSAKAKTLDRAELSLAEPGENGIANQLSQFWDAWSDLANGASDPAAKQALVEEANAVGDSFQTVYSQIKLAKDQAYEEYKDLTRPATATDPGGEISQIATEIKGLNDTITRYITAGDVPNDLMDRRDLLLDQLSGFGQVSVTDNGNGSVDVAFVDTASSGTTYGVVDATGVTWAGPPAADAWSPGGRLGGLLDASKPGGPLTDYLSTLDKVAGALGGIVNAAYGGTFFTNGAASTAMTLTVAPGIAADPTTVTASSGAGGPGDIALKVSQLRNDKDIDQAYRAFVAQVGSQVRDSVRQEGNAQVMTDAVENRRQSVAGVSLDEEMTNVVKFQRAYQASSRAMSTMDEMLDVLINRTGRVGL